MNQDDDDDLKPPRIAAGDVGIIFIAGAFLLGFLYLMFGPSPLEPLLAKKSAAQEAPAAEVTISVPPRE